MIDRDIERLRYDNRANLLLDSNQLKHNEKIPKYINPPYKHYFKLLKMQYNQSNLLEIGAGMGENTSLLVDMLYKVCSTDLSLKSVEVMTKRFSNRVNFSAEVADMEKLPFDDESFDIVCSAGSLSYGDNELLMNEIYRVLKKGGVIVIVDSLNNSFIYQLNRYVHYLKGNRSKSTLTRIPTISLIDKYTEKFGYSKVKYFGSIAWIFPFLSKILNEQTITNISNWVDSRFNIKKSAFKFVMLAIKNEK